MPAQNVPDYSLNCGPVAIILPAYLPEPMFLTSFVGELRTNFNLIQNALPKLKLYNLFKFLRVLR